MNILATKDQLINGMRGARADADAKVKHALALLNEINGLEDIGVAQARIAEAICFLDSADTQIEIYFANRETLKRGRK